MPINARGFLFNYCIYIKILTMYTTIAELKQQLNIESGYTEQDSYLLQLLQVAELSVENYTNFGLTGYTGTTGTTAMPICVKQATLMLASHFYLNRQVVAFATPVEIPFTFRWLLDPYKNYFAY